VAGFLGRFLHQLDPKGRISLPAQFRRGRESESFVLIRTQPEALTLYPEDAWADVQNDLLDYVKRQPEHRHKVLRITADAIEVVPDKQGRILIPERMRKAAGSSARSTRSRSGIRPGSRRRRATARTMTRSIDT
jgi:MraZ protein